MREQPTAAQMKVAPKLNVTALSHLCKSLCKKQSVKIEHSKLNFPKENSFSLLGYICVVWFCILIAESWLCDPGEGLSYKDA